MITRLIGDVHGKFKRYREIIRDVPRSLQVGDMGVGFLMEDFHGTIKVNGSPPHDAMRQGDHRFIRGNHDNLRFCDTHPFYIPDGTIESGTMFVGGALSVDKDYRTPGLNWWEDEELSYPELMDMLEVYVDAKPRVMVTHECPEFVADEVMKYYNKQKYDLPSRTRQAFQGMIEVHQPELWVFGHWHHPFDQVINGTRFICLAELEWKDLEI